MFFLCCNLIFLVGFVSNETCSAKLKWLLMMELSGLLCMCVVMRCVNDTCHAVIQGKSMDDYSWKVTKSTRGVVVKSPTWCLINSFLKKNRTLHCLSCLLLIGIVVQSLICKPYVGYIPEAS